MSPAYATLTILPPGSEAVTVPDDIAPNTPSQPKYQIFVSSTYDDLKLGT